MSSDVLACFLLTFAVVIEQSLASVGLIHEPSFEYTFIVDNTTTTTAQVPWISLVGLTTWAGGHLVCWFVLAACRRANLFQPEFFRRDNPHHRTLWLGPLDDGVTKESVEKYVRAWYELAHEITNTTARAHTRVLLKQEIVKRGASDLERWNNFAAVTFANDQDAEDMCMRHSSFSSRHPTVQRKRQATLMGTSSTRAQAETRRDQYKNLGEAIAMDGRQLKAEMLTDERAIKFL